MRYIVGTRGNMKGHVSSASSKAHELGFIEINTRANSDLVIIDSDQSIDSIRQAFGENYIVAQTREYKVLSNI